MLEGSTKIQTQVRGIRIFCDNQLQLHYGTLCHDVTQYHYLSHITVYFNLVQKTN